MTPSNHRLGRVKWTRCCMNRLYVDVSGCSPSVAQVYNYLSRVARNAVRHVSDGYINYLLLSSCQEAIKQVWSNLFHRGIRRPEGSMPTYNYLPEHTCDAGGILVMIHTRVQPCLKLKEKI